MADKHPEPTAQDEHPDRDPRALPQEQPEAPGEGREVVVPAPVTGMALGGPTIKGVTPESTEEQEREDIKTAGGTKGTKPV